MDDQNPIPSMLHHFDKSNLNNFIIEKEIEILAEDQNKKNKPHFAPKLSKNSKFRTSVDVANGALQSFEKKYMNWLQI